MAYIEILLEESNISGAQTVVNNMPSSSPEETDYATIFSVLVYAKQNNLSLRMLPKDKVETRKTLLKVEV